MTAPQFADTNLLIYAFDRTEPEKQERAREWLDTLWRTHEGRVSYQVLSEFYAVCARKLIADTPTARNLITGLMEWQPATPGPSQMRRAWTLQDHYSLSWWDALVVASAKEQGCGYLLTEDLQEGQDFEGMIVINPFRTRPSDLR